jgi:formylglycine-generating enzyme required for sulfatase activity
MLVLPAFFSPAGAQTITMLAPVNLTGETTLLRTQGVAVSTFPLAPRLASFQKTAEGAFAFDLIGPPGNYTVFASSDLLTWNQVGTLSNTTGTARFTDTAAFLSPQKFYRASLQGTPPNMVLIQPNIFKMGSPNNEQDRDTNEGPQTTVTLTHAFWIGQYEVTQQEFMAVMGTNPSAFPGDPSRPVSSVSWFAATDYCTRLTQQEIVAGRIPAGTQYRLPTEAEWECAARAGTSTRFSYGDDPSYSSLANFAWFADNAGPTVHPVGRKLPNPWGLYDMAGNVWEWCQDWFGPLPGGVRTDPSGPASSSTGLKVMRGGAFDFGSSDCRSARRNSFAASPFLTDSDLGFRVVLTTVP